MKTSPSRPNRAAKIDARVPVDLREKVERIAAIQDIELAEIVRRALREHVTKFEIKTAEFAI